MVFFALEFLQEPSTEQWHFLLAKTKTGKKNPLP